jgi:FkbM family methyltransferase
MLTSERMETPPPPPTFLRSLTVLKEAGWTPGTIIDIGVSMGTEGLYDVWPGVPLVLVDPVKENQIYLKAIAQKHAAQIFPIAASNRCARVHLNVHTATGLAQVRDAPKGRANWDDRMVDTLTMDEVMRRANGKPPFLYKLDTDAHEREILSGSKRVLAQSDVCVIESCPWNTEKAIGKHWYGAPRKKLTLAGLVGLMDASGFVVTDIAEIGRNDLGLCRYIDFVFVRRGSALHKSLIQRCPKSQAIIDGRAQERRTLAAEIAASK